ncbi:MAG: hypothetical protein HY924_09305 [Elusimicrobia bacterium]|nr:hypothetical protein [Elusimicrobiota bacterium]
MRPARGAAFILALAATSASAASPVAVSGYVKDLWSYSRSAVDRRPYFLNTARQRLSLDGAYSILRAHADYDHEELAGSFFRTQEHRLSSLAGPGGYLQAEEDLGTTETFVWRHRLYRWWAGIETDAALMRFGRQRVAWGTGKLFNPTDVLNLYDPLSVEKDERPGVDALYARQSLGELSQVEAAWAVEEEWGRQALLARVKSNWRSWDVSLMGGKTPWSTSGWIVGGDLAGDAAGGTLRGEWACSDPGDGGPYCKLTAGYDYSFASDARWPGFKDLSVMVEYHHNGAGTADSRSYDHLKVLSGREVFLAKDYVGAGLAKDLHPLVKLDLSIIANLDDLSVFTGPSLTWDVGRNLFLTAGFQRFSGSRLTEFGRPADLGFLQVQFFF